MNPGFSRTRLLNLDRWIHPLSLTQRLSHEGGVHVGLVSESPVHIHAMYLFLDFTTL